MPTYYFNRLEHLNFLIRKKATGPPKVLAKKLSVSERTVFQYIDILKSLGAEVRFCHLRKTYYYIDNGTFNFQFQKEQPINR
jgi:predicted DNA-binding transcriptional regulator YafY